MEFRLTLKSIFDSFLRTYQTTTNYTVICGHFFMRFLTIVSFSCLALGLTSLAQAQPGTAVVLERGANHTVWQFPVPSGDEVSTNVSSTFVELASGLNFLSEGQWLPSREQIEVFGDGAIARQGQFQVVFNPNINDPKAIQLVAADDKVFVSRVAGLAYHDIATGASLFVAELKDSVGQVDGNQVHYLDAFAGGTRVDLRYTFLRGSFEQDAIFKENLPKPSELGLNDSSTRLEIWTEFFNPPTPEKKQLKIKSKQEGKEMSDQHLDFGTAKIGVGRAFGLNHNADEEIPVAKEWVTIRDNGTERTFLVEGVEFPAIAPVLQSLPENPGLANRWKKLPLRGNRNDLLAQLKSVSPASHQAASGQKMKFGHDRHLALAKAEKGLVLDYLTVNGSLTNYTFKADTSYAISGPVYLYGTSYIEGGTVIKMVKSVGATIEVRGQLVGETNNLYRPAVITAYDDNNLGPNFGGILTGTYATTALYFDYVTSGQLAMLHNLRILNAAEAIRFNGGSGHEIRHLQIVDCTTGIKADNANYSIRNALIWNATTALNGSGTSVGSLENTTFNTVSTLISTITGRFTNCLLTAVTTTTGLNGSSNQVSLSSSGVYQTSLGGFHYLSSGSTNRNVGTTNINAGLAADLRKRTTYAPLTLGSTISANTILGVQATLDFDLPDLGYHYAPLDYLASGVTISSNVTVIVTNGASVGLDFSSSSWGFILKNSRLISEGSPLRMNYIGRAHNVQEKSGINPATRACFYDGSSVVPARNSALNMRFTEFSQLADDGYLIYIGTKFGEIEWNNSRVYNPSMIVNLSGSGSVTVGLTNTLWERGGVTLTGNNASSAVHLRNNLIRNMLSWHFVTGNSTWTVRDNLFDSVTTLSDNGTAITNTYNAYFATTYGLTGGGNNVSLGSLSYQIGTLGKYYQPVGSSLINGGSRLADAAGLYHYVTTTNQVKEINSTVDIGIHYVALNGSNAPIDTDGDSYPDYWEDRNGDGVANGTEQNWNSYNSPNGLSGTPALQVYTPLK